MAEKYGWKYQGEQRSSMAKYCKMEAFCLRGKNKIFYG